MKPAVGFFGLGAMGYPIAGRLARAGYAVAVADLDPERVARWRVEFTAAAHDPAQAAIVVTCVTDAAAMRELALGRGALLDTVRPGTLLVDHTTIGPALAWELAGEAAKRGAAFVDAPTSGGADGAAAGTLAVMAGGAPADLERARPLLQCYAAQIVHIGPVGSGALAKLANQIAIAGTVRALAEAVALARAGGVEPAAVLEALAGGTAASAQLARSRLAFARPEFAFTDTFGWLEKDLALALEAGTQAGLDLPLVALVHAQLEGSLASGPDADAGVERAG
jgi:3-hydroxyisobutyrate dehydrogenase-like beta-hydroxyacid dehydrogenase